ncbi:MAG: hypothetical protein NUV93_05290 [Firmicutes bacterium]|jgi:hypothetical protein|nr:hypothetical protein [Bacillota bacterium]
MKSLCRTGLAVLVLIATAGCGVPGLPAKNPGPPSAGAESNRARDTGPVTQPHPSEGLEELLPFPKEELGRTWAVGPGLVLLEHVRGDDTAFFLYEAEARRVDCIVGVVESARFKGIEGEEMVFMGRGGDDTQNFDFPYTLRYELHTGRTSREYAYLPLDQAVALGKNGWRQVLSDVRLDDGAIVLDLTPAEGQVLAGAHNRPLTTVRRVEGKKAMLLTLYGVEPGERVKTLRDGLSVTPRVGRQIPVVQLSVRSEPHGKPASQDLELFSQGFPYGLKLRDIASLETAPRTSLELALGDASEYTLETIRPGETGGALKFTIRFR